MNTVVENDQIRRALALGNSVGGLVVGEKRDAKTVADILQTVNDHPDFADRLHVGEIVDTSKIREELILWQKFDRRFFPEVNVGNYTALRMPNAVAGFDWPIVNARGITTNALVARIRKEFEVYTYIEDLNPVRSDREPVSSSYIVLVRPRVEADEELKSKSAEMLAEEAIPCITLPETLRLQFFYWYKTGQHLDVTNITLSAGSRDRDGHVPSVRWRRVLGRLRIGWCGPGGQYGPLRSRAVSV